LQEGDMPRFRRRQLVELVDSTPGDPAPDHWALGQGEVDGKPLIVRWDTAARRDCPDATRPIKVTIGLACDRPQPNGLPSPHDLVHFEELEEALFAELPSLADTRPVLVLTTNGMREWIVYACEQEWLQEWAPWFAERFFNGRAGTIEAVAEPGWDTFQEWTATS
jgi:hypothetical protein